jgi:Rrf2 family transcriptional regulator, iron-sulfur cluster assembly transcription factor
MGWGGMLSFGKTSAAAVAAVSYLAEHYPGGRKGPREIAAARGLTAAHVAKVLTRLSALGLVEGTRGPGGGYALARPPGGITLAEVVAPFEQGRRGLICPFGPDWCGKGAPCPLHERMVDLMERNEAALNKMNFGDFAR